MGTVSKMEEELNKVGDSLEDMPSAMRIFTLCLRSLFVEYAVGKSSSKYTHDLMELRDRTRDDAQVYLRTILPVNELFIANIKEYFEIYEALTFEEWKTSFDEIKEMITQYSAVATTVVAMHESLIKPLKEREDEAKKIALQNQMDLKKLQKEKDDLEELAGTQKTWATYLLFLPVVAVIASPILHSKANSNIVDAMAAQENAEIVEKAIMCIGNSLVPSLKAFIKGLQIIAGSLKIIEQDLLAMKRNEKTSSLYYTLMKSKSKKITTMCDDIFRVIPAVKTDIAAIPSEGTDENYVDGWVKEQKQLISKNCSGGMKASLFNALKSIK